ncbi:protein of unknown function [Taphrina deformans PYCC 5710]|uniref:Uncharacterized protein n=1 Tax=Taphrina deformans (strain PYCC 5710 / ATCC 11124 / CBS 356.35 / IMI 108563 / JCM 9778 / NBRC 8474) TaxID=1097556 RepID=R4XIF0_TAPDE|nr:protein of unknown function [Taphrina deformans PYCC 5710]|eukprot:CCG83132.1 protein of unknown function [Taphrina deformans PYCC 5710]
MERPEAPRRKSSTSEVEELQGKQKAHRKTFVVGAAKSHHRIPSYGKKLNQLGKLTALTSTEPKGPPETTTHESSRRGSFHRSSSQRSLGDSARRSSSAQNLQKLRRSNSQHGSTAKLTSLRPMTKMDASSKTNPDCTANKQAKQEDVTEDIRKDATNGKRATFIIEDDEDEDEEDEDEADDVASSFAKEAFLHEKNVHNTRGAAAKMSGTAFSPRNDDDDGVLVGKQQSTTTHSTQDKRTDVRSETDDSQSKESKTASRGSSGLLYNKTKKLVDPLVSTDSAISRDIQIKERPPATRSLTGRSGQNTPINSQPLTSRFLESPRKDSMPTLGMTPSLLGRKENAAVPLIQSVAQKPTLPKTHHSPHGSTTNLGLGSSRTQQKLLLQRASSIRDMTGEINNKAGDVDHLSHPRCQKELERISREYKNAKRFRDPLKDLSLRLYAKGLAISNASPLRRTMTQTALNHQLGEMKTPRTSQSTADLKHRTTADAQPEPNNISKILQDLWLKDDYKPAYEE